ncbi:MAG: cystathionine gamma-synthase [Wenzhouxiangellaceae bacterium]|nr:cystathionine gamma-synthase [Wenzhouxiangellaceae bacterium]
MALRRPTSATRAVRAGIEDDRHYGAVVPPIHMTSTFTFEGLGQPRTHDYSRSGNPTRDLLADALRDLEGGAVATVTATGMAAITTVLQLVEPGRGPVLAAADCYGGTWRLLDALAARGMFELEWVDFHDPAEWARALSRPAAMVWLESPSNPLLRITDIRAVSRAAHLAGALVVVDNTFLSPALQNPIEHGADVVVHSTTKYINGHSDVVGGAVVAADPARGERIAWWANCLGVTGSAFDCWLALRGLRTLEVRIRQQQRSTGELAGFLQRHPAVSRVHYPGLADHPGHELAARQQRGFGAVVSFELEGGLAAVERFVDGLGHLSLAESLGGVETLLAHPATMTHAAMTPAARNRAGIGDGLLRLSVGLEDPDDLRADLDAALERAGSVARRPNERAVG